MITIDLRGLEHRVRRIMGKRLECECCGTKKGALRKCKRCEKHVCHMDFCRLPHDKARGKLVIRHYDARFFFSTWCGMDIRKLLKTRHASNVTCKRCLAAIVKAKREAAA